MVSATKLEPVGASWLQRLLPLALLLALALSTASAGSVSVRCMRNGAWPSGTRTVVQHTCHVALLSSYRNARSGNAVCVSLDCDRFRPGLPCSNATNDDCSWNVSPKCTSPFPLYPGSTWTFGFQTYRRDPSVKLEDYAPAKNNACE